MGAQTKPDPGEDRPSARNSDWPFTSPRQNSSKGLVTQVVARAASASLTCCVHLHMLARLATFVPFQVESGHRSTIMMPWTDARIQQNSFEISASVTIWSESCNLRRVFHELDEKPLASTAMRVQGKNAAPQCCEIALFLFINSTMAGIGSRLGRQLAETGQFWTFRYGRGSESRMRGFRLKV